MRKGNDIYFHFLKCIVVSFSRTTIIPIPIPDHISKTYTLLLIKMHLVIGVFCHIGWHMVRGNPLKNCVFHWPLEGGKGGPKNFIFRRSTDLMSQRGGVDNPSGPKGLKPGFRTSSNFMCFFPIKFRNFFPLVHVVLPKKKLKFYGKSLKF